MHVKKIIKKYVSSKIILYWILTVDLIIQKYLSVTKFRKQQPMFQNTILHWQLGGLQHPQLSLFFSFQMFIEILGLLIFLFRKFCHFYLDLNERLFCSSHLAIFYFFLDLHECLFRSFRYLLLIKNTFFSWFCARNDFI